MNATANGLVEGDVASVAIDARGHGGSGAPGDMGHIAFLRAIVASD
jgi:alpha-beta hydrolase superfamily lysophospholipase